MRFGYLVASASCCVLSVACASSHLPQDRLTSLQGSLRAAEELQAADIPQAALHLTLAREQAAQAQKAIAAHELERASMLLARADSDAQLALALARVAPLQAQASEGKTRTQAQQDRTQP